MVWPQSVGQLEELVALCCHVPRVPLGTGHEGGINAVQGGNSFDLCHTDTLTELSLQDFLVTVGPVSPAKAFNSHLCGAGLWFPVETAG
ncbi:LDHD protein, partial [Serilophus lunatus]|nr:LDHD protein [Serilophus lunatus]